MKTAFYVYLQKLLRAISTYAHNQLSTYTTSARVVSKGFAEQEITCLTEEAKEFQGCIWNVWS